jgi:hypothetical protein
VPNNKNWKFLEQHHIIMSLETGNPKRTDADNVLEVPRVPVHVVVKKTEWMAMLLSIPLRSNKPTPTLRDFQSFFRLNLNSECEVWFLIGVKKH